MTLYHATPIENKDSIINDTIKSSHVIDKVVFGFENIDSAHEFGVDCCGGYYAIFSFECENVVIDKDYDGESYYTTDDIENVQLIYDNY